jgi:hypothetical protein
MAGCIKQRDTGSQINTPPMPRYPDEYLPSVQMSLQQFCDKAEALLNLSVDAFVRFVLSGRFCDDDGIMFRATVNARDGARIPQLGDYNLQRDIDSAIGITHDLPFTVPMAIFPLASFTDTLKKNNHIQGPANARDVCNPISPLLSLQ